MSQSVRLTGLKKPRPTPRWWREARLGIRLRGRDADMHPDNQRTLKPADQITVFADTDTLRALKRVC